MSQNLFDFVDPAQLSDPVFDLLGIHNGFFSFQVKLHPIDIVQLNCSHPYFSRLVTVNFFVWPAEIPLPIGKPGIGLIRRGDAWRAAGPRENSGTNN
jgi:hypothetical protein